GATTAFVRSQLGVPGPSDLELAAASALPVAGVQDLVAGQEYFGISVLISHQKTVGAGSCAGCATAACINLRSLQFTTVTGPFPYALTLSGATVPGSDAVTWQGGAGVPALPGGACAGATPTRNGTWGGVKSLYR